MTRGARPDLARESTPDSSGCPSQRRRVILHDHWNAEWGYTLLIGLYQHHFMEIYLWHVDNGGISGYFKLLVV